MKNLFNDGWLFAEYALDETSMYEDGKPVLFIPEQFYDLRENLNYAPVRLPHDWQIRHVKELYKNEKKDRVSFIGISVCVCILD